MVRVVPEGSFGTARVEHVTVNEHQSQMTAFGGGRSFVSPGRYAQLFVGGEMVMSDTPYERRTNWKIANEAKGRVLIAGYGLGMILTAILKNPAVTEAVVIEKTADVVSLVDPHIRKHVGAKNHRKLTVQIGDVFHMRQSIHGPFDCLWFDIWSDVNTDALQEMTALTRRYRSLRSGTNAFMDCWDRDYLRYQRERERRAGW